MNDWGEIKLTQIENGNDFWYLFNELLDDKSQFYHNKTTIVEEYKNNNLYGLRVDETSSMFKRGARADKIFIEESFYLLPCFCIKNNNTAIIIWTHTRARRNGFAKKLVNLLNIQYVFQPLPESIDFWEACNIKPAL